MKRLGDGGDGQSERVQLINRSNERYGGIYRDCVGLLHDDSGRPFSGTQRSGALLAPHAYELHAPFEKKGGPCQTRHESQRQYLAIITPRSQEYVRRDRLVRAIIGRREAPRDHSRDDDERSHDDGADPAARRAPVAEAVRGVVVAGERLARTSSARRAGGVPPVLGPCGREREEEHEGHDRQEGRDREEDARQPTQRDEHRHPREQAAEQQAQEGQDADGPRDREHQQAPLNVQAAAIG